MLLAMIVLTGLGALAVLTVSSVQGGTTTASNDRFQSIATYAAESGGAAAIEFLRANVHPSEGWKAFVTPSNASPVVPTAIVGNEKDPGEAGNPFSADMNASYRIEILNNRGDAGYAAGLDSDMRVVIRSTGYGPNGAVAIVELEVASGTDAAQRPCTGYAQENMSEDNSALNECLKNINFADTKKFKP